MRIPQVITAFHVGGADVVAVGPAKREREYCVATVKTHASAKPVLNSPRAPGMAPGQAIPPETAHVGFVEVSLKNR